MKHNELNFIKRSYFVSLMLSSLIVSAGGSLLYIVVLEEKLKIPTERVK